MNRDEKRNRIRGLPPAVILSGKVRAILPREPNGGTWIAVNNAGLCLALINWHRVEREPRGEPVSRGIVIDSLVSCVSTTEIARGAKRLPLRELRPFRLIAVDGRRREVIEWQWDLRKLQPRGHGWRRSHWFSSGFDEPEAERLRAEVCASGDDSLRELHRSHLPMRGPFSICMHRQDAATVSYTEVALTPRRATMRYVAGAPCSSHHSTTAVISLV